MILWVFRGQERQSHSSFVQEAATVDFQEVPDVTVEKRNIEHNWCSDFFLIFFWFFIFLGGGGKKMVQLHSSLHFSIID